MEVLTTGATVTCVFGGTVTIPPPAVAKLVVGGQPVVTTADVSGWTVAGCTATTPAGAPSPCAKLAAPTAGVATKLVVLGFPVLLVGLAAPTVPSAVAHTASATDAADELLDTV